MGIFWNKPILYRVSKGKIYEYSSCNEYRWKRGNLRHLDCFVKKVVIIIIIVIFIVITVIIMIMIMIIIIIV